MKISTYISEEVQLFLREAIKEANGNEVFFLGRTAGTLVVESADVLARGNKTEVPAIIANCRPGDVVIHNHPSGLLEPSPADNKIASHVGNEGVGFYIINNDASAIYVGVEPVLPEEPVDVSANELESYLGDGSPLTSLLEGFEIREPQRHMLADVADAFNNKKIALIEAGTGTGKTLAYLLPAIKWAAENKKRVVISTNTINLQQQITEKDIPVLQKVFPQKFQAVLVKGRTNYLCLRKMHEAVAQPSLLDIDDAQEELDKIAAWAEKTSDGSKSDLSFLPSEKVWEHVQSESDTTLRNHCKFYHKCFFYNARRRATTADLLIANHHLLFADLSVRTSSENASEIAVLPKYERLILDEAHNLEEVASRYFGVSLTYAGVARTFNRLHRAKGGKETGQLPFLVGRIHKMQGKISRDLSLQLLQQSDEARTAIDRARAYLTEIMERIYNLVVNRQQGNYELKLRLTESILKEPSWQNLLQQVPMLIKALRDSATACDKIIRSLTRVDTSFEREAASLAVDIKAQAERLINHANEISFVLMQQDDANIRWVEVREGRFGLIVRLCTSPLDVAPIMKKAVFDRFPTVVMTSATLTVNKTFDFFAQRIGLSSVRDGRLISNSLASPFNFQRQAMIGIPTDVPEPNDGRFNRQLPELLQQGIEVSRGRAFVLFTSYSLLNDMYQRLEEPLRRQNIALYRQGQENRHHLLNRFRTDRSSVLFATDSFWEGVDVKGDALVNVIIPRLPFRVPSDPVIEARVEAIEKRGGNAFLEYSVPQAVLKFKQGFGRLIRSRSDYGLILILDRRVVSKFYGRVFLASLPECNVVIGAAEEVFGEMTSFLEEKIRRQQR